MQHNPKSPQLVHFVMEPFSFHFGESPEKAPCCLMNVVSDPFDALHIVIAKWAEFQG